MFEKPSLAHFVCTLPTAWYHRVTLRVDYWAVSRLAEVTGTAEGHLPLPWPS